MGRPPRPSEGSAQVDPRDRRNIQRYSTTNSGEAERPSQREREGARDKRDWSILKQTKDESEVEDSPRSSRRQ
jgi:hypothetical protein